MSVASYVIANDLRTGRSVFWSANNNWSLDPKEAILARNDQELDALGFVLKRVQNDIEVVGAYIVQSGDSDPALAQNGLVELPKKLRERRRLEGPGPSLSEARVAALAA